MRRTRIVAAAANPVVASDCGGFLGEVLEQPLELLDLARAHRPLDRAVVSIDAFLQAPNHLQPEVADVDPQLSAVHGVGGALHQLAADQPVDAFG